MTEAEKVELAMIPVVALAVGVAAPILPARLEAGTLIVVIFVLLLAQSLLRDLWLLTHRRPATVTRMAQCMCVESAVGVSGLLAGGLLIGAGVGAVITMAPWAWPLSVGGTASVAFLIKDFVLEWNPWSIRREHDHRNVVMRWKR